MDGLREAARETGVPMVVQGYPPVFYTAFAPAGPIVDYRDNATRTDGALLRRFVAGLQDRGIRVASRGTWFLSGAHTREDIDQTLEASFETLRALGQS